MAIPEPLRRAALAVALLLVIAGCQGGTRPVVLDGSPRPPDAEGVVRQAGRDGIELVDGRRFAVSSQLRSFSTYTLEPLPLVHRTGQYVHLGLDGDTAVWVATIGAVVEGQWGVVFYTGTVAAADADRVVFDDGTMLRWAPGLDLPPEGTFVTAEIDPERAVVARWSSG